jgi:tetratricopeptide (TPR) repeat protein
MSGQKPAQPDSPSSLMSVFFMKLFHLKSPIRGSFFKSAILAFGLFTALTLLSGCSCEDPKVKFDRLMQEAQQYFDKKDYKAARVSLLAAVELQPKNGNAYFKLAEAQVHLAQIGPAVENYNTAINYSPDHRDARLHLASIMLAGKQFELSENHVQSILDKNPEDSEALILKANLETAGTRKNTKEAKKILEAVLKKEPNSVSALASMAQAYLVEGDAKSAEEYFNKALKSEPENRALQMALADLYARQGRLDEAQKSLKTLVDTNPEQSGLRYIFGEFLLRRGQADGALEQYQETLKTEPERHNARDRLYDMYLARQKPDEAKALTADLIAALPEDPGVSYFKGRDLELEGKLEEALVAFLDSIKLINNFAPAFRRAGLIEMQLGKEREGVEHLNQAIAIDAGDVGARLAMARHLYLRRELDQATEHVEQILARYPRQFGANLLRADIALLEGDLDVARKVYEFFVEAFPENPNAPFKMGLLEERSKNFDKAREWYKKTLGFDENVLAPARRYAMLTAQFKKVPEVIKEIEGFREKSKNGKGEYDLLLATLSIANQDDPDRFTTAKALFERAISENGNLIGAYAGLGALAAKDGNIDAAIENYKKLLEKNPEHLPSMMLLAGSYERKGAAKEAAEVYENILKRTPRFAPAANNLAYLLAEELNGSLDDALKYAQIAKEELTNEGSVADTLGWIHYKRGSARVALPILEEAVDLEQEARGNVNPEILYHLAVVKKELGDAAGAKKAIADALKAIGANEHPKKAEMEKLLGSL